MFYLLICGSRSYSNYHEFEKVTDFLLKNKEDITIISGGAKGADKLAEEYCHNKNIEIIIFNAEWNKYGKSAGFKRNVEMINFIKDKEQKGVLSFWDMKSKGTEHSIKLSKKENIPIRIFDIKNKKIIKEV